MNQIVDEKSMHIPKKKSVALLTLLCIITVGIYFYIWFIKRSKELDNLQTTTKSKRKTATTALIFHILIIFLFMGLWAINVLEGEDFAVTDIANVPLNFQITLGIIVFFLLIQIILVLTLAFNTKKILDEALINKNIKRKTSALYTLFLSFLYLQYEINRVITDTEMKKRVGPLVWFLLLYIIIPASIGIYWFLIKQS